MTGVAQFQTENLTVRYGGVTALDRVSMRVEAGQFAGLIGPNGAGKTTFIDAVTGFAKASGRILLDGRDLLPLPAHRRVAAGIGRTFQSLELFEDLTIRENVLVASEDSRWWSPVVEFVNPRVSGRLSDRVEETLELVGLSSHTDAYPPDLSLSQRKLVCVARALATRPRFLLLDEPAAGLDSDASLALGRELQKVAASGVAILLVDHDMDLVMQVCETIAVLNFGRLIALGPAAAVRNDTAVVEAYLGQEDEGNERESSDAVPA
jgi:ABC-type branched-subunit amino acid transport system ATPase component